MSDTLASSRYQHRFRTGEHRPSAHTPRTRYPELTINVDDSANLACLHPREVASSAPGSMVPVEMHTGGLGGFSQSVYMEIGAGIEQEGGRAVGIGRCREAVLVESTEKWED
ncbi:hypothetical protein NMY22_g19620 [Coprinellus aureogranulatus]|nr:hypothetical protein NMY22_g19620 [Coprinellus aureogranulatus]